MPSRVQQQDLELHIGQEFANATGILPPASISRVTRDPPDLCAKLPGGQVIGIEVCQILQESSRRRSTRPKQQEAIQEVILRNARAQICERENLPPLRVRVTFRDLSSVRTSHVRKSIATELIGAIKSARASVPSEPSRSLVIQNHELPESLQRWVDFMVIARRPPNLPFQFDPWGTAEVNSLSKEQLAQIIGGKAKKLEKAHARVGHTEYTAYWLLLYIDHLAPSSCFHLPSSNVLPTWDSTFHRVFVFDRLRRECVELIRQESGST
ncbi:hypothetical protein [Fontivita pretiosa]|uniref:hypothetical protein n=1 Tax=Fontivita pretiosa TaxID=2989684 RepID=UPI003D165685